MLLHYSTSLPLDYFTDERDYQMSRVMVDLWTNFAKYGNPTPTGKGDKNWKAYMCRRILTQLFSDGKFIGRELAGQIFAPWAPSQMDKETKEFSHVTLKAGRMLNTADERLEKRLKFWRYIGKRLKY